MKQFFYPKKMEPELDFEQGILKVTCFFVGFVFIFFFSLQSDRKQQVIAEQKKKKKFCSTKHIPAIPSPTILLLLELREEKMPEKLTSPCGK